MRLMQGCHVTATLVDSNQDDRRPLPTLIPLIGNLARRITVSRPGRYESRGVPGGAAVSLTTGHQVRISCWLGCHRAVPSHTGLGRPAAGGVFAADRPTDPARPAPCP